RFVRHSGASRNPCGGTGHRLSPVRRYLIAVTTRGHYGPIDAPTPSREIPHVWKRILPSCQGRGLRFAGVHDLGLLPAVLLVVRGGAGVGGADPPGVVVMPVPGGAGVGAASLGADTRGTGAAF